MGDIKVFGKWDISGIKVEDPGLVKYICLEPKIVPKTGAKQASSRFKKQKTFIVERLINKLMVPGHKGKKHFKSSDHITGKAANAYDIVKDVLGILEQKTNENPIAVLVKAIENSAQREELLTIEYGGARYPRPVECAPQRRIDIVLRLMVQGSYQKSFNTKKSIQTTLSEEILNAYKMSNQSIAVSKKLETERQCDSAR